MDGLDLIIDGSRGTEAALCMSGSGPGMTIIAWHKRATTAGITSARLSAIIVIPLGGSTRKHQSAAIFSAADAWTGYKRRKPAR